ncbi:MAG: glycosyltransferase [Chloroflexi bacterium]|nr:glycosyltransferase [Chloroflexota bacterium]
MLVPPQDPDALAEALRRLLADEQLRLRMSRQAVARVQRHFTWQHVARGVALVNEALLRGEAQPQPERSRILLRVN